MESSNKNKIFNIVFSLIFLGVMLTFSLFFLMSSSLRPEENISNEYFSNEMGVSESDFFEYDDRFLKSKLLHSLIVNTEYRFFGNVKQGNVIKGRHGFLFEGGTNEYGYDYITDYFGGYTLSDEELARLFEILNTRKKVYEDQGRHYILAVIPNSQTIYSEYMPAYMTGQSHNTVLSQISEYMESRGDFFLDLTDELKLAKPNGILYNNTENSVNAKGAYYIYKAVMDALPESVISPERKLPRAEFEYYTHYTRGKSTAAMAGLEFVIRNETVSMSNNTDFKYAVVDYSGDLETTYVKSAYRDEVPLDPYVLIECSNEWDKIQLMPYFSNTFGVSSYKVGHGYNAEIIEQSNPLVVVQTVHEYELVTLLSEVTDLSYRAALLDSAIPYKTKTPQLVEYAVLSNNSICVSGIVESGAEIQLFGDGFEPVTAEGIDGRFFVELNFEDRAEGREVFLNAKSPDKAASDLVTLVISGQSNVGSARNVLIGSNSMLYRSDYETIYDLPDKDILDAYEYSLYKRFSELSESNGTNDTRIIFALLPEKISVYTDGMPEQLREQSEILAQIRSTFGAMLSSSGAYSIDLSKTLRAHLDGEKMFAQTGDVITDIAYYYMYSEIINSVFGLSPEINPVKIESFLEYSVPFEGGTHASSLGFENGRITEVLTKFKFTNSKTYLHNSDGSFVSYGSNVKLPSAVIVYDDASKPLVDLLVEHFGIAYVMRSVETGIPDSVLSSVSPDYIIYLCREKNIEFTESY